MTADEALAIGLANRVVPGARLGTPPRNWPPRWPRCRKVVCAPIGLSALHQWGHSEAEAMDFEFGSLSRVAAESLAGARRFAEGAGRHGAEA